MSIRKQSRISRSRKALIIAVAAVTAGTLSLLAASNASAVLSGSPSNFEANDGNMVVDTTGQNDWASVSYDHVSDLFNSNSDDSFTPGQKQDSTCPDVSGHKNSPKDDFTDVASYSETNATSKETYLYGATIRYAANGNASENVELKQGTNGNCTNGLLARTDGDKLIAIDYLGGGTSVQFNVLTWVVSGACFVSNDIAPCWGATVTTLTAAGAEGKASQSAIAAADNPINGQDLVAGQFAEFGVNLATAGIIPAGTCKAFPQTVWESRASGSSFVSSTKDVAIENHTIRTCGEVKIIKHTSPRGVNQDFSFTSNLSGGELSCTRTSATSFTLNDNGNTTGDSAANTQDCTNVPAGSYHVTEGADPTGFVFDHLSCTVSGAGASGTQDATTPKQADITVTASSVVTCTYVNNQQLGAIKISKTNSKTHNALAGATFSVTKAGTPIAGSPFTTNSNGVICVDNLVFADYVVTETGAPTGYAIDDATAHTVTVDNNAKCSDSTFVGEAIAFGDTPLSDIQVRFKDEGSGTTSATITCDNTTGTTSTTGTTGWDTTKTVTGIKAPTTVHCTIVIDP